MLSFLWKSDKMITINSYALDSRISSYKLLTPFTEDDYVSFAEKYGVTPQFHGERFFWAGNYHFLCNYCKDSMVAAISDIIYKISFKHSNLIYAL